MNTLKNKRIKPHGAKRYLKKKKKKSYLKNLNIFSKN